MHLKGSWPWNYKSLQLAEPNRHLSDADKAQYSKHHDDESDDINDIVHVNLLLSVLRGQRDGVRLCSKLGFSSSRNSMASAMTVNPMPPRTSGVGAPLPSMISQPITHVGVR